MALSGFSNSAHIEHGSGGRLDNVDAGTVAFWVFPTDNTARQVIWTKSSDSLQLNANATPKNLQVQKSRNSGTAYLNVIADLANFAHYGIDKWVFVVATWDINDVNNCTLHAGDLSNLAAEPSSYSTQTAGSGTPDDNSGSVFKIGRHNSAGNRYFVGRVAKGWHFDKVLSAGERANLQWSGKISDFASCIFYTEYGFQGAADSPDWTGNGFTGTQVSTLTVADHVPLGPTFGSAQDWSAAFTIAGGVTVTRADLDRMFVAETATVETFLGAIFNLRAALDGLFIKSQHARESGLRQIDSMLLAVAQSSDRHLRSRDYIVTASRLVDMVREIMQRSHLLAGDGVVMNREMRASLDTMLCSDTVMALVGAVEQVRAALDGLNLDSFTSRELLTTKYDALFVDAVSVSEVAHTFSQGILISDTAVRLRLAERRVIDGVLLADSVLRAFEHFQLSGLPILDSVTAARTGEIVRYAIDALLLFDTIVKSAPQSISRQDGLLFSDSAFKETVRVWLSSLLTTDTRVSALERKAGDTTYLLDSATLQQLAGIIARTGLDPVFLSDRVMRLVESQQRDTALLSDTSITEIGILRELIDRLLLLDSRAASERYITRLDVIVLHTLADRLREMLSREGLLQSDSGSVQWFPVVIEFITYARLMAHELLGLRVNVVDLLGRRLGAVVWRMG